MAEIGIVVGGSEDVWRELDQAKLLLARVGAKPRYFVANDMIDHFHGRCIAGTLHVDKLPMWLKSRTDKNMEPLEAVWICTTEKNRPGAQYATYITEDVGGSVGLFLTRIATREYGLKVILCGVPMDSRKHFVRGRPWNDVLTFEHRWNPHIQSLRASVRSFSGKTKEWFGEPDINFIQEAMT